MSKRTRRRPPRRTNPTPIPKAEEPSVFDAGSNSDNARQVASASQESESPLLDEESQHYRDQLGRAEAAVFSVQTRVEEAGFAYEARSGLSRFFGKKYQHAEAVTELEKVESDLARDQRLLDKGIGSFHSRYVLEANMADLEKVAGHLDRLVEERFGKALRTISVQLGEPRPVVEESPDLDAIAPEDISYGAKLGEGADAIAYQAKLGEEDVVAKMPGASSEAVREGQEAKLQSESQVMKRLQGKDNLVQARGMSSRGDRSALIMEFCENGDLGQMREKMDTLEPAERMLVTRYLVRGELNGVANMHEEGLVHGDVKLENTLLDGDFNPKVADFGTTREATELAEKPVRDVGTVTNIAPEVTSQPWKGASPDLAKKNRGLGMASDLWSVGEDALMLATGRNSVDHALERDGGKTHMHTEGIKASLGSEEHGDWHDKVADQGLRGFVKALMAFDPTQRMSAADALASSPFLKLSKEEVEQAKGVLARLSKLDLKAMEKEVPAEVEEAEEEAPKASVEAKAVESEESEAVESEVAPQSQEAVLEPSTEATAKALEQKLDRVVLEVLGLEQEIRTHAENRKFNLFRKKPDYDSALESVDHQVELLKNAASYMRHPDEDERYSPAGTKVELERILTWYAKDLDKWRLKDLGTEVSELKKLLS